MFLCKSGTGVEAVSTITLVLDAVMSGSKLSSIMFWFKWTSTAFSLCFGLFYFMFQRCTATYKYRYMFLVYRNIYLPDRLLCLTETIMPLREACVPPSKPLVPSREVHVPSREPCVSPKDAHVHPIEA